MQFSGLRINLAASRFSLLKQIPIKLTLILANKITFRHLNKLIGNRTTCTCVLLVLAFHRLFFTVISLFSVHAASLYLCSCLFRKMVDSDCDIRRLYEKQTHRCCSSHAIFRKTSLQATRGIDCKRQIVFARKRRSRPFFIFISGNSSHVKEQPTIAEIMRQRSANSLRYTSFNILAKKYCIRKIRRTIA